MSDIADLAFDTVELIERPAASRENNYVVAWVRNGKTTLQELRCTHNNRAAEMLKQFGIRVAESQIWAVGQVVGDQIQLCGPSVAAQNAIRATHPELRVAS